jgi:hypothetical protein
MRHTRNDIAVSEVLGAMLLLSIAVLAFSVIYFYLVSDDGPAPQTYVYIVGDIDGQNITLTHTGGESLDANDKISFTIRGVKQLCLIKDKLNDENGNGKWDLGEKIHDNFTVDIHYLDQYEFIDVQAIDSVSNAIAFQGPVYTRYKSDVGVYVTVNTSNPVEGQRIIITVSAWCLGGDFPAAGGVVLNCALPEGLDFISCSPEQGTYDQASGEWYIGNLLVEDSPVNLTFIALVNPTPYHESTQLGIIFDGSDYTSGSSSIFKATYLNSLMFALAPEKYGLFPTDGCVELTVVGCGFDDPPRAFTVLNPTTLTEDNVKPLSSGQGFRNDDCSGGDAPISSAIRLVADKMSKSMNYSKEKKQIVLIVCSGHMNCIWDDNPNNNTKDVYQGIFTSNENQVNDDTINAVEYLKSTIDFNVASDEVNAITVAKTDDIRDSSFLNESIVMPQPGNIYNMTNPIIEPGWVFESESGKNAFQLSFNNVIRTIFSDIFYQSALADSTTIDPNSKNNYFISIIKPIYI